MSKRFISVAIIAAAGLLSACMASTQITATGPTAITVRENEAVRAPSEQSYKVTTFIPYLFKAEAPGARPFYGLLPLKTNRGYILLDWLFLPPAIFFNAREVYPYYEFDVGYGELRYRRKETDAWRTYRPSASDIRRAKAYFANQH